MSSRVVTVVGLCVLVPLAQAGGDVLEPPQSDLGEVGGAGHSLSLSGTTLAVGSRYRDVSVYVGSASSWTFQQTLVHPPGQLGSLFGRAVSVEGDRLLVGSPREQLAGHSTGAVHVFERQGSLWTEETVLIGQETQSGDEFGWTTVLDGDAMLVGSPRAAAPVGQGAAYVFRRQGTNWVQEARLTGLSNYFLWSNELDFEGGRALIGNEIFVRQAGVWVREATLPVVDDPDSVSLSGAFAAVGDQSLNEVYLFQRSGSSWTLHDTLTTAVDVGMPRFGNDVDLNGSLLAIADSGDDSLQGNAGSAYLFERQGASWVELRKVDPPVAFQSYLGSFGTSVVVDTESFVVGQQNKNVAHAYDVVPPVATYCTALVNSQGCVPVIDAAGSQSLSDPAPLVITAREILNQKNGLFFYGTSGAINVPFLGGTLCALPPLTRTPIQNSGGSPPPTDCSGAFLFDLKAWALSGVDPDIFVGGDLFGQFWSRDPGAVAGAGLTDAVSLGWCP